jgi:hypothetical protein
MMSRPPEGTGLHGTEGQVIASMFLQVSISVDWKPEK